MATEAGCQSGVREASENPPDAEGWPRSGTAWYAVLLLAAAQALSGLDRNILNILVDPIKHDIGATDTQMGLLLGFAFALFYTTIALPMGRLADRVVRKRIISVGMMFWCMATAASGLVWNYTGLFLARMAVGVGEASLNPAAFGLITDSFPPKKRARPLSVFVASQSFGSAIAIFVGGALIQYFALHHIHVSLPFWGALHPWQCAYLSVSLPGFLVALLVLTIREPSRRNALASGDAPVDDGHPSVGDIARHLLAHANIYVPLFLCLGFLMFVEMGRGAWLPTYFIRSMKFSPRDVGIVMGTMLLFLPPLGAALCGWISDRIARTHKIETNMTVALCAILLLTPFAVGATLVTSPALSLALLIPTYILTIFPVVMAPAAIALVAPNRMRGQVTAVYLLSINMIGYGIGPAFVGFLNDKAYAGAGGVRFSLATIAAIGLPLTALMMVIAIRQMSRLQYASAEPDAGEAWAKNETKAA